MKIHITHGFSEGKTELSAFDGALFKAGIANFNLIELSSIIPPRSSIKLGAIDWNNKGFGKKLYVVLSKKEETRPGKSAFAGIGWCQDNTGKGLFVEHSGSTEKEVKELINKSLTDMKKIRNEPFGDIQFEIKGITCKNNPVSVLVCAVYKIEGWINPFF